MSDKYEQAAKKIGFNGFAFDSLEEIAAYLREQFPEPVKIEGVRELAGKILSKAMEVFDSGMECEIADIITDFIQTREAGKSCESGWLIEKKAEPTLWWNGRPKREGIQSWTSASLDAIRFSRQYDAEMCAISQGYSLSAVKATEHQWG